MKTNITAKEIKGCGAHEIQRKFARLVNFEKTFFIPPLNADWLIPE